MEESVRQQRGEKQDLLFFMGFSTAWSIWWLHSLTKSRRNWTVVHVLSVEVVGETLCFLCFSPSTITLLGNTHLFNSLFESVEEFAECQDLIFWVPAKRLWCFFCKGYWKLNDLYSVQNRWGWKHVLQVGEILLHFFKFQIWYFHRPQARCLCGDLPPHGHFFCSTKMGVLQKVHALTLEMQMKVKFKTHSVLQRQRRNRSKTHTLQFNFMSRLWAVAGWKGNCDSQFCIAGLF